MCPAGKLTVGFGHVIRKSDTLSQPRLSLAEARALLRTDLGTVEVFLNAVCAGEHRSSSGSMPWRRWCSTSAFGRSTSSAPQAGQAENGMKGTRRVQEVVDIDGAVQQFAGDARQAMFAGCSDSAISGERARLQAIRPEGVMAGPGPARGCFEVNQVAAALVAAG